MKILSASILAILLASAAPLHMTAAEPESSFGLTPSKPDTILPEGQGGLPLIPDALPPLDEKKGKQAPAEKKSATSAAEDALRDAIKLRVAKTKAQSDPELQALWDTNYKAKTDWEQREIFNKYYTLLCAKIAKIDSTINPETIESIRGHYLGSYDQSRIAPTVPPEGAPPSILPPKEENADAEKDKGKKHKKKKKN